MLRSLHLSTHLSEVPSIQHFSMLSDLVTFPLGHDSLPKSFSLIHHIPSPLQKAISISIDKGSIQLNNKSPTPFYSTTSRHLIQLLNLPSLLSPRTIYMSKQYLCLTLLVLISQANFLSQHTVVHYTCSYPKWTGTFTPNRWPLVITQHTSQASRAL